MTAGQVVYSMGDFTLRSYLREVSRALVPTDAERQKELQAAAWCRISLENGDSAREHLLRTGLEAMLREVPVRRPEVRRARGVVAKYLQSTTSWRSGDEKSGGDSRSSLRSQVGAYSL